VFEWLASAVAIAAALDVGLGWEDVAGGGVVGVPSLVVVGVLLVDKAVEEVDALVVDVVGAALISFGPHVTSGYLTVGC
jgi:hypothetical protein